MNTIIKRRVLSLTALIIATFLFTSCQKEIATKEEAAETQFFTFTSDGISHTWRPSPYHLYAQEDTSDHGIGFYYNMVGAYDTVVWSRSIQLVILRPSVISAKPPFYFDIESVIVQDQAGPASLQGYFYPLLVSQATVTEFGPIGGYISGNFSGTYIRTHLQIPNDTVTVSCSWRIKREAF